MFKLSAQEKHIKTIRRHPLVLVFQMLPFVFGAYLTLVLQGAFINGEIWTPLGYATFPAFPEEYVLIGANLLLLFLWFGATHLLTDFYLDTWIITDQRIIGILQRGFFSRQINSFRIERIQDVQTDIHGLFPTLFGIGDVHIETAGHQHDLVMQTVGSPQTIRRAIMDVIKEKPGSLHGV
ncbi:MAG: PH domain-containing protein [Patescibacteria group bacterium UBA2103]